MLGASGHVTTKPAIRDGGVLNQASAYARKALCLTPGALPWAIRAGCGKSNRPCPMGEVSTGQSRRSDTDTRRNPQGRTRNPPCRSKEQVMETLCLNGLRLVLCPL
jgi:hypothetical protein